MKLSLSLSPCPPGLAGNEKSDCELQESKYWGGIIIIIREASVCMDSVCVGMCSYVWTLRMRSTYSKSSQAHCEYTYCEQTSKSFRSMYYYCYYSVAKHWSNKQANGEKKHVKQ